MVSILHDDDGEFADGTYYEVVVREIPAGNDYPEGERYSFQYMRADGSTLLRYDNYTAEHGARHHRHHYQDGIAEMDYQGWVAHLRMFTEEMNEIHDERH